MQTAMRSSPHLPLKPWLQMSQYAVISLSVSLVLILFWTISFNGDIPENRALKKVKFLFLI